MRIELHATPADHQIAKLTALAIALSLAEAAIPSPLPGVKPGLANIIVLVVLYRFGWSTAAWVNLMRVATGSLLLGQLLAPGFFLALAGALASLAVLGLAQALPRRWFGPVSLSILAALAHISGQLLLVYLWLIPNASLANLLPLFFGMALVSGLINGLIAAHWLASEPETAGG